MPRKKISEEGFWPTATKMKSKLEDSIEFPQGIIVNIDKGIVTVKGPKGELKRNMYDPKIKIVVQGNEIKLSASPYRKKEKTKIYSQVAHLKNMFRGVQEVFVYKLKICAGHFPMNVSVSGNQLIVKNFLGEKVPRVMNFSKDIKISVDGEIIKVEGCSKEVVSQTAAMIEILTRRVGFDRRIFQDGIYIVEKDGKKVE